MKSVRSRDHRRRVKDQAQAWRVDVERVAETHSSILAFGRRDHQPVVLKVIKSQGDEWTSGEILAALQGQGVVRVYDYCDGAVLLEWLTPGHSLADAAAKLTDDAAIAILAATIKSMSRRPPANAVPTLQDWGDAFGRYHASRDTQIPQPLVTAAHDVFMELSSSQRNVRLLHGDLHHGNVLLDIERGWVAIDPKGVMGELEYEVGAALRNPLDSPKLFASPAVIQKRIRGFRCVLELDVDRVLSWAFAQAILAGIWGVEGGARVTPDHGWLAMANALLPMLERSCARPLVSRAWV